MKWLTWLSIFAVFILGAVVGTPLGMKLERDRFLRMQRGSSSALMDNALRHIGDEVKLSPEQNARMRNVLEEAHPDLVTVEQERREKIVNILEKVRTKASSFLSDEQKQRYVAFHERIKNKLAPAATAAAATAAAFFNK